MDTTIALAVGLGLSIIALVILLIKYANLKEDYLANVKEVNKVNKERLRCSSENADLKMYLEANTRDRIKLCERLEIKTRSEASLQRKVEVLSEENKFLLEHGPTVLSINLNKELYNKTVDGEDDVVLVENKEYWTKQLLDDSGAIKEFHVAELTNGRRKGHPRTKFEVEHIELSQKERGKDKNQYFHIHLGERLN